MKNRQDFFSLYIRDVIEMIDTKQFNLKNLCKLCKINEATQDNSHIFSKFLGKSMRMTSDNTSEVYYLKFEGTIPSSKQDIPKENKILCQSCETKLNDQYENYCSKKLQGIKKKNFYTEFYGLSGIKYKVIRDLNYKTFKLFAYSLLWRASVSNLEWFKDLNLTSDVEENFREILNNEKDFIDYPTYILTPEFDNDTTKNTMFAWTKSESFHILGLNEFIVIFDIFNSEYNNFPPEIKDAKIWNEQLIKFGIIPYETWEIWRVSVLASLKISPL